LLGYHQVQDCRHIPNFYYYSKNCCYLDLYKHTHTTKLFYFLSLLFSCIFLNNRNILFVYPETNYNYLPISNKIIFNRAFKDFLRLFSFFRIGVVIFVGLQKTIQLRKLLRRCGIICITVDSQNTIGDWNISTTHNINIGGFLYRIILQQYLNRLQ